MTCGAARGRLVALMAVHAPLHLYCLLELYHLLLHHVAMATLALDLCCGMFAMAEEDEVGNFVDPPGWYLPVRHIDVADTTLRQRRKAGQVAPCGLRVARGALEL